MTARRKQDLPDVPVRRPATTPEAREMQMIDLAVSVAEKQMLNGTASSQVISHYLKLATSREKLEQDKLRQENDLLRAKTEQMASAQQVEVMYKQALDAMRSYSGQDPIEEPDD